VKAHGRGVEDDRGVRTDDGIMPALAVLYFTVNIWSVKIFPKPNFDSSAGFALSLSGVHLTILISIKIFPY